MAATAEMTEVQALAAVGSWAAGAEIIGYISGDCEEHAEISGDCDEIGSRLSTTTRCEVRTWSIAW